MTGMGGCMHWMPEVVLAPASLRAVLFRFGR